MKSLKRSFALFLALAITLLAAGCSGQDMTWSYKDDQTTLSIGTYIFYNMNAYQGAAQKVKDSNGDFLSEEIEDEDGTKMTAREYINKQADLSCKNYLNVEKKFKEMELSLTETETEAAKQNALSNWSYYKQSFEGYGISQESYLNAASMVPAKYEKIFKALYGKGGEKEVPVADLTPYFLKHYTSYKHIAVPLYTSESNAQGTSTSTAISEKEVEKIKKDLDTYANAVNKDKKSFEDQIKAYMKAYSIEEDPTVKGTAPLEDTNMPEELTKAYNALKEGESKVIKVGEEANSSVYYFIYKAPIADEKEAFAKDETKQFEVLAKMKSEEYNDEMDKQAKSIKCEINQPAVDKYKADMFITYKEATDPTK